MIRIAPLMLAGLVLVSSLALAHPRGRHPHPPGMGMGGQCHEMMADMKSKDAILDEKLAAMNAAQGEARVDAMAALLTELVAQRKAMHEKMGSMSPHVNCPMMSQ